MSNKPADRPRVYPLTVRRQTDKATGKTFLQGREYADAWQANVFGDGDLCPLEQIYLGGWRDGPRSVECIVVYRFFSGGTDDWAEVYSFWIKSWRDTPDGPQAETIVNGEDFCAYHEDSWGSWQELLVEAGNRVEDARHNFVKFKPRWVGAPKT